MASVKSEPHEEDIDLWTVERQSDTLGKERCCKEAAVDDLPGLPIDKGWAWMILLAASIGISVFDGIARSAGIFFVHVQEKYDSSASKTTLIQTVFNIFSSLSGVFIMTAGMNHMSARTSICVGGILTSVSYAVSAYSKHIEVLIFTLGAVAGSSWCMIYLPALSAITMYFNKHRGLANSIAAASSSVGLLVFGPLYTLLFDHYGFSGTLLIASGVLLNILLAGCLMRPSEFYTRIKGNKLLGAEKHQNEVTKDSKDRLQAAVMPVEYKNEESNLCDHTERYQQSLKEASSREPKKNSPVNLTKPMQETLSSDSHTLEKDLPILLPSLRRCADEVIKTSDRLDVCEKLDVGSCSSGSSSNLNLNAGRTVCDSKEAFKEKDNETDVKLTLCKRFKSQAISFLKTVFDTSLLKNPVYIHYILFASVAIPPPLLTSMYCVPFATDIGISNQKIGILMFVMGCMDLVSRGGVGVVVDKKILRPTTIITIAYIIMAVINNLTRLVNDFWGLLAFVVIQASLGGVYMPLYAVILTEHIGQSKFKCGIGFTNMFHGASMAVCFPITGKLRDITGAYYWTYHLLSFMLIIAAVLAVTLPLTHSRNRNVSAR